MNKQRRHFAGAEKVAILKRHLVDKVPISDLCDELGLYPNLVRGLPGFKLLVLLASLIPMILWTSGSTAHRGERQGSGDC